LFLSLSANSGGHNSWSGRCSPISGSSYINAASISASEVADLSTASLDFS
jgi:hypothetical protein